MRFAHVAFLLVLSAGPALAQRAPVLVIPARPDIPVLMNGVDVSWSVIDGEFGLDRPGMVVPTVAYRPYIIPLDYGPPPEPGDEGPEQRGYFPSTGKRPGYGRLEIIPPPNRRKPPPAQSYRRSWTSQSDSGPVTDYAPYDPPPVYIDGGIYGGDRHGRRKHGGNHGGNHGGPGPGPR